MAITLGGFLNVGTQPGDSDLSLDQLRDVSLSALSNRDFLMYNDSTKEWNNSGFTIADLQDTTVAPGTYNNITVNSKGLATLGTNVSYLTSNQPITITGDATGTGASNVLLTLNTSGVTAGTYGSSTSIPQFTVDSKGRITSSSNLTIPSASTVLSGLFSAVDKSKLDSIRGDSAPNQTINAGDGLSGGGSGDAITIDVTAGDGITVAGDNVAVDTSVARSNTAEQTFSGNVTIAGNLIVQGDFTEIADTSTSAKFINFNFDNAATGTDPLPEAADSGFTVWRGGTSDTPNPTVGLQWNEIASEWQVQVQPGGTFEKIWTTGNDGSGTGLDADLLDGQQGDWYRDASNLNSGILSEGRLPSFVGGDVTSNAGSSILTLSDTGVSAGSYGAGLSYAAFTVDSKGRIISASEVTLPTVTVGQTGLMSSSDKLKLDSISNGAKPNQNIVAGSGISGGGSGDTVNLDLDGTVPRTTGGATVSGDWVFNGDVTVNGTVTQNDVDTISVADTRIFLNDDFTSGTPTADAGILVRRGSSGYATVMWDEGTDDWMVSSNADRNLSSGTYHKIWHSGNMGNGSGLDADLLDGLGTSYFTNASNLLSGTLPSARFNDTSHGNRGGGSLHSAATTSTAGFMSATDKTKLNSIASSAQPNQTINSGNGLTGGGSGSSITINAVGGDGITANADNIAVDNTVVRTSGTQNIANLNISGSLNVTGTTTLTNIDSISSTDPHFVLNTDFTGSAPTENQGMIANRGTLTNQTLYWHETNDEWSIGTTTGQDLSSVTRLGKLWHSGNDGAGSGLNADLLDGLDSSAFAKTSTTITAGSGLTGGGTLASNRTLSHADTSSQASVTNPAGTVIQDITLDGFGHITDIVALNLDNRYVNGTNQLAQARLNINNRHFITENDGGGNFNFRVGHEFDGGTLSTEAGTAFHQVWDNESASAFHRFYVSTASATAVGQAVTFREMMSYDRNSVVLKYQGNTRLTTTSAGVTLTGECTASSFNTSSSKRYKSNIRKTGKALATKLMKVDPVSYTRKADGKKEFGLIAEEIQKLFPEIIGTRRDGSADSIDYSKMVVPLIAKVQGQDEEMKEQSKLVRDQARIIETQSNQIIELSRKVDAKTNLKSVNATLKMHEDELKKRTNEIEEQNEIIRKLRNELFSKGFEGANTDKAQANAIQTELDELRSWKGEFEKMFHEMRDRVIKTENNIKTQNAKEARKSKSKPEVTKPLLDTEKPQPKKPRASKLSFDINKDKE